MVDGYVLYVVVNDANTQDHDNQRDENVEPRLNFKLKTRTENTKHEHAKNIIT